MKFECALCNYKTNDFSNYNRHLSSKRHTQSALKHSKTLSDTNETTNDFLHEETNDTMYKFQNEKTTKTKYNPLNEYLRASLEHNEKNDINLGQPTVSTNSSTFLHNFAHFCTFLHIVRS